MDVLVILAVSGCYLPKKQILYVPVVEEILGL